MVTLNKESSVSVRHRYPLVLAAWAVFVLLLVATTVSAYAGPGVGPEVLGPLFSLVAWVAVAVGTVLLWPFYTLMRWLRGSRPKQAASEPVPNATTEGNTSHPSPNGLQPVGNAAGAFTPSPVEGGNSFEVKKEESLTNHRDIAPSPARMNEAFPEGSSNVSGPTQT
jgi:hypothetical protein